MKRWRSITCISVFGSLTNKSLVFGSENGFGFEGTDNADVVVDGSVDGTDDEMTAELVLVMMESGLTVVSPSFRRCESRPPSLGVTTIARSDNISTGLFICGKCTKVHLGLSVEQYQLRYLRNLLDKQKRKGPEIDSIIHAMDETPSVDDGNSCDNCEAEEIEIPLNEYEYRWMHGFLEDRIGFINECLKDPGFSSTEDQEMLSSHLELVNHLIKNKTSLSLIGDQILDFEYMLEIVRDNLIEECVDEEQVINNELELEIIGYFLHLLRRNVPTSISETV